MVYSINPKVLLASDTYASRSCMFEHLAPAGYGAQFLWKLVLCEFVFAFVFLQFLSSIQILITILIYALYAYLAVGTTERFFAYEEEFRYTIPKSVKLTSLQMIYTIIFFVCSQTYYISLSCMTYYPFQQEKIAIKFWSPTLLFCPLINIFTLPTIHLAICVHNSNSIHFSRQHPGTRLKWDGMKKWNAISGKWEIDESPKDHEILNLC